MNEGFGDLGKYSSMFAQESYAPQPETLAISRSSSRLYIGVPLETTLYENRVPLVPNSVQSLIGQGHRVVIQEGAGERSNYSDRDYSEAGAEVTASVEEVYKAEVILRVAPPSITELDLFHPDQILISPLQIPIITEEYIEKLRKKRVIAVAMEYMQADDGSYPIVRIMSEIAGISAMHTAAELLSNAKGGRGVLLGGISGVGLGNVQLDAGQPLLQAGQTIFKFGFQVFVGHDIPRTAQAAVNNR